MTGTDALHATLKKLRLSGILETLDLRSRQAGDENLSHSEFLFRLLCDEVERRDGRQLEQRLRRANFESHRTLEDFDWRFNPELPKEKLLELGTCSFVAKKEVVLLCGPSGTGKSHLAQALGHRACRIGHSVLYTSAHSFFTSLRAARADNSYDRLLLRFGSVDLLILDDLGLRPLAPDEAMDLYELIRLRYERGAMLCTSNRAASEWGALFGDALLASAAMDRLLHHAHVVVMDGPSYRTQRTPKRKPTQDPTQEATP